ncbi:hypothetical protein A9R05_42855 (plasmid) [Burkholderia sp. KK1]|uniref:Uncharacterized protein n=1 Tax=Burkholderia sp. M701 TaxID=326454 RepID=V5YP12_9BURK|nr:hypothetical protein [Burkholderia sp. M701]AQH05760.1 hypothetical protein A9R05_42855 [Burkholderia sp. KK1]BAO18989.1 hypothetical protein [Burkholderia sp. M701]
MDIEKAQQMMATAVKATLECGQYQAAKTIMTQALVAGKSESATCLIFGRSESVLDAIAERVNVAPTQGRLDTTKTSVMTPEQREQLELIARSNPAFIVMHLKERTVFDAALVQKMFELAKDRARDLLAAHPL